MRKLTREEFIEKAKKVHWDKYDYSKVEYVNGSTKICIVCPLHGEFWQTPNAHLNGHGCKKCQYEKLIKANTFSKEEFIEKAKKVHGDKYDYSKVEYVNNHTKVCIICPKHGEFWQTPNSHLHGNGCAVCGRDVVASKLRKSDLFFEKAAKKYNGKYSYDKSVYVNAVTKMIVTCNKHGDFSITPHDHLKDNGGCLLCKKESISKHFRSNKESFIEKARKIHGDKYDYSKVEYLGAHDKVCIICPIHGEFWVEPNAHLNGANCPQCSHRSYAYTNEEFISIARKIHDNKYDYSKVEYVNNKTKICIICPIHGEFWQTPSDHLDGHGCPKCNQSTLEKCVMDVLTEEKIEYAYQKRFDWLGKLSLDFYLPSEEIAIECQGGQHYRPIDFAGKGEEWAKKLFEATQRRDKFKLEKVTENGIKMIYINEENKNNILKILKENE